MTYLKVFMGLMLLFGITEGRSWAQCQTPKPTGVQASKGTYGGTVRVTWDDDIDTFYKVYRSDYYFGTYKLIGYASGGWYYDDVDPEVLLKPKVSSATTNLNNRIDITYSGAVINEKTYYYKVKGSDYPCSDSSFSDADYGWGDDRIDPNSTYILWSTSRYGSYSLLASNVSNSGSYSHTGLGDGVTRWYKLLVVTAAGSFIEGPAKSGSTVAAPPPPGPTSVSISGPTSRETLEQGTWTASVSGGSPPYSYQWQYRDAGTSTWYNAGGNSSSFSFLYDVDFELRVTATDSNNYSKTSNNFYVVVNDFGDMFKRGRADIKGMDVPDGFYIDRLGRDRSGKLGVIRFGLPVAERVLITIENIDGKMIETLLDDHAPTGNHIIRFDPDQLPPGDYRYRIRAGNFDETRWFLVK